MCNKSNFNEAMKKYAEYRRIEAEAKKEAEAIKSELIAFMQSENIDTLSGIEHKATYKPVASVRFDTKVFKLDQPELYDKYSRETVSNRFNFS